MADPFYFTDRKDWRAWLENNFDTANEVWLVYPNKSSGKPRIGYNEAVEEALCFGWIDSTVRKHDEGSSMQRFTPRNPKSSYSQSNKERLRWLLANKMVHASMIGIARQVVAEEFIFPEDILGALKDDNEVWINFLGFSEVYRRIRVAYVDGARKRPAEFRKRLENLISKTRENRQIGFGGIEKYY